MPLRKKRPVTGGMRVNAYQVFRRALEEGIRYGWQRAHKHRQFRYDPEDEESIMQHIDDAVAGAICEVFEFDE